MNKQKEIIDLMKPYFSKNRIIYSELSHDELKYLESKYNIVFPQSFCWFITKYYFEGISVKIPGKAIKTNVNCLDQLNINYRNDNYPSELFIISHCDEFDYCLDTRRYIDGECPVVTYSHNDKDGILDVYSNFYDFLIDEINNAIENNLFL